MSSSSAIKASTPNHLHQYDQQKRKKKGKEFHMGEDISKDIEFDANQPNTHKTGCGATLGLFAYIAWDIA